MACVALASLPAAAAPILVENFDSVANLVPNGWAIVNNSSPAGTTDWFQGNPGVFSAHSGAPDSYVSANFEAAGFGGNISSWLISPLLTFDNGDVIDFWSRTEAGSVFPDRLELRLSLNGSSTNVGATDASVGDFSTLLLTINPALAPGGFPENWAHFSATLSGLGGATGGRFAFRYNVSDTSVNADVIGIDTVTFSDSEVTPVPEPGTLSLLSIGAVAAGRKNRRRLRRARVVAVAVVAIAMAAVGMRVVTRQPSSSAASPKLQKNGLVGMTLTDEHMNFRVATRNADGSIGVRDVLGRQQAEEVVRANGNGTMRNGEERGRER